VEPSKPVKPAATADDAANVAPNVDVPRRLSSKDLFGQANRLRIMHGGEEYLLQITRQGKLLLTK
jgi:hemin uptake protein HemP